MNITVEDPASTLTDNMLTAYATAAVKLALAWR